MSSKNDSNKIINLPNRQSAASSSVDRLGEPLKSVRELTLKRIAALVNTLFENIDDALFDLAEHALTNTLQNEYFEGMREVRKKRQRVERLTLDKIGDVFTDFSLGKIQPPRFESVSSAANVLSLVEEEDLEESLAIAGMVAKTESRLARHLYALNRRLTAVRGGVPADNATNPIGPVQLCETFRIAMGEFELNLHARIIVYKLFERYVLSGLEVLYDEVNARLIHAGVLPQLRHHVAHSITHGHAAPPPQPSAGEAASAYANQVAVSQQGGIEAEIYQTLRSLLALRHSGASAPIVQEFSEMPQPSLAPTDLLSALQILQNQTLQTQANAALGTETVTSALQLKQAVIEQADKLHAGSKSQVARVDEDTIDLVGMLFEFIVQDRNLPAQMQALLGRLQIPYLKVAILDRHLFTQKTHPARQLLDNMAQACIGKSDDTDTDQPLYDKIKLTVETLLRDFDDDLGLFEQANSDFSAFLESSKRRAELAEKRTAESVQGREKLEYARHLAAGEIRRRCETTSLPPLFHSLLSGPWTQFLVLIALRQGTASAEWKQALSFADALIWSSTPKIDDAERTRVKNFLPPMLAYLRQGLTTVAWQNDDIHNVVRELNAFYKSQLESATSPPGETDAPALAIHATATNPAGAAHNASVAALVGMMEKTVLSHHSVRATAAEEAAVVVDESFVEQVRAMQVGTWVEFSNPDTGIKERAKLSWISPISSKYLFVDRKGLKVADKTIAVLAAEMSMGRVALLEDSMPLFDRAMGAIVERLKSFQPVGNNQMVAESA